MTQKQQEQLEKFIKFTSWMYKDCARAELFAGSQFLSALGLFNYIEIVGAFLKGYFKKDIKSGRILKFKKGKRKGNNVPTTSLERFNAFFVYLGQAYKELLDQHPEIYKELRCGLTHEFIPKSRKFCIIKVGKVGIDCNNNDKDKIIDKIFNEVNFDILNPFDSSTVDCGVIFSQSVQGEMWLIFPLKLAIDFGKNIEKLINEIRQDNNKELIKNFFETATQINLENFN